MADLKPARKQATVASIKQFVVGKKEDGGDFEHHYIEQLIVDLSKWFSAPESGVKYDDPIDVARSKVKECLLGLKADGTVWQQCGNDFKKRLKMKCNYDLDAKRGVPVKIRIRQKNQKAEDGAKAVTKMQPIHTMMDVAGTRNKYIADILDTFPELDNPAHIPNVESLADVYTQRKLISMELEIGVNNTRRETLLNQLKTIETMADSMMNKLGIHPNQVRKKVSETANSSIADLVAQISEDEEFMAREKQWSLQLALQLWWMSEHNNYSQDGPNVSDFEIWSMTRSRPVRYKCSCEREVVLVEGFEPHELRDWLVKEGVLVEESVIPTLTDIGSLDGLATFQPEVIDGEADTR